ncbi:MAG: hypothetical protein GWP08_02915 [Nitrospiraceae bacterium]|nr:hypothetical protein [Nitrospiraceae bacterium]
MKRHPSKRELLAYAESCVDGHALSASIGGHIAACSSCAAEAAAMRLSLEYVAEATDLEPSSEFTANLLLAAKQERAAVQAARMRHSAWSLARGAAYAASLLLVAALSFGFALDTGAKPVETRLAPRPVQLAESASNPETALKAAAEIQTLAMALGVSSATPRSPWELERRRAASAQSADIAAARAALARNPGCVRASRLMDANLERLPKTLKALYVERSL